MKNRTALAIPAIIAITIGVVVAMRSANKPEMRPAKTQPTAAQQQPPVKQQKQQPPSSHTMPTTQTHVEDRVPAHYKSPPSKESLRPTLDPEQFTGPTRAAYKAVKEIPQTIAQLPCYCYCDESFGHKSLHSCFEDDHGAHCAVCVNEVLMAYRMEKELKLTPAEIRERIVAQYSAQQQ
ncbi:MAG TPA: CYCXC family (seleno)protein [Pyrinomonadaceae bacterium]|jgi:hypothetical protein